MAQVKPRLMLLRKVYTARLTAKKVSAMAASGSANLRCSAVNSAGALVFCTR